MTTPHAIADWLALCRQAQQARGQPRADALARLEQLRRTPQPAEGVTYAHKIEKHEALIDWTLPAEVLARRVRAFDPFPGALTHQGQENLKIWAAFAEPGASDADAHQPEEAWAGGRGAGIGRGPPSAEDRAQGRFKCRVPEPIAFPQRARRHQLR